jgi:hypothetical protein
MKIYKIIQEMESSQKQLLEASSGESQNSLIKQLQGAQRKLKGKKLRKTVGRNRAG